MMLAFFLLTTFAASAQEPSFPPWLLAYIGIGENQVAPVVLERARALYFKKTAEGKIKNPCYFAMDATRPHQITEGKAANRFYVICEREQSLRFYSAGHGYGKRFTLADFVNQKTCVKNFSNAARSQLTMGGAYLTAEIITSYKGYYPEPGSQEEIPLHRRFLNFDGEGETANARNRDIGGHPAELVKSGGCWKPANGKPEADPADGLIYLGEYEDYTDGRSNGCTTWNRKETDGILDLVKNNPTSLYIYPEAADIAAATKGGYWNAACLQEIKEPKFWAREEWEPILEQWEKDHPPVEKPKVICGAPPPALSPTAPEPAPAPAPAPAIR